MIVRRLTKQEGIALASVMEEPNDAQPGMTFIITGLEPDEPVFVVRARDAAALPAVNAYSMLTEGLFSDARANSLEADRNEIIAWRRGPGAATLRDPD